MEKQTIGRNKKPDDYFYRLHLAHYVTYNTDLEVIDSKTPEFLCENPYPISEAHLPFLDHFNGLLKKKREYLMQLEVCRKEFQVDRNEVPRTVNKKSRFGVFPQYMVDLCTNTIKDPDVCFPDNCGYNWYYTGGALDCVTLCGRDYVVTPAENNNLWFTKPSAGYSSILETNLGTENPIYSIRGNLLSDDSLLLTLRQKHQVSVMLGFTNEDNFFSCLQFENHSDIAYCDAKLSDNSSLLYTLKTDGCTEIFDISSGKKILQYYHCIDDSNVFSIGQIASINPDTLVFSNRSELVITDSRFSGKVLTRIKRHICDDICSFTYNNNNFIYVATKHHLVKYDLRKTSVVATYAHMLESEPYLISSVNTTNSDLVCLANQNSKILIECNEKNSSLPLLLPSIKNTYDKMQVKTKVHNYRNLEERLLTATIGLKLQKNPDNSITLFSLSTAGDVFQQKLTKEELHSTSENKLSEWIEQLPRIKTELLLTEVTDMSDAKYALNRVFIENQLKNLTGTAKNLMKSTGQLYGEENYLGSHLEEIWLAEEIIDEEELPEMDTSQKVSAWLSAQDERF